jgi:hypothetical protein
MARSRRELSAFSLSFLDIMSCGFGAAILLFLIMKHNMANSTPAPVSAPDQTSEVSMLEEEIRIGQENLVRTRNTISELDDRLATAQGMASRIMEEKNETASLTTETVVDADSVDLEAMKSKIKTLERQNAEIREEIERSGEDARKIAGEGRQRYLTGLNVQGRHLLILLDGSASMLDNTIVNVIRFRNMRDELKRNARKWQRTLRMVEWLTARMPLESRYQVYLFNTETRPANAELGDDWLDVRDKAKLDKMIEGLHNVVPENGTNLQKAFAAAARLSPPPDNIYLITDGLPTQGGSGASGRFVSPRERLKLFNAALKSRPPRTPVNVILTPLEGDADAAPAFWALAQNSRGTFISPSQDWP